MTALRSPASASVLSSPVMGCGGTPDIKAYENCSRRNRKEKSFSAASGGDRREGGLISEEQQEEKDMVTCPQQEGQGRTDIERRQIKANNCWFEVDRQRSRSPKLEGHCWVWVSSKKGTHSAICAHCRLSTTACKVLPDKRADNCNEKRNTTLCSLSSFPLSLTQDTTAGQGHTQIIEGFEAQPLVMRQRGLNSIWYGLILWSDFKKG
eukprot:1152704-Pelagomonas_calceolata.AAC.1